MAEVLSEDDDCMKCLQCERVYYNVKTHQPRCPFCFSADCRKATEEEENESVYTF